MKTQSTSRLLTVLFVSILLLVSCFAVTSWADISGTVINNSSKKGWVYLILKQQNGGTTGNGINIDLRTASQSDFTIRGVADGNFVLYGHMDVQETGSSHASDPAGVSAPFTISGNSVTGVSVTLTDQPTPVFSSAMSKPSCSASASGVVVRWDHPRDVNGILLADSYKVYWSTGTTPGSNSGDGGGTRTIPADNKGPFLVPVPAITAGNTYTFSVAAVVGGDVVPGTLSPASNAVTIQDSVGTTITGTVDLTALAGKLSASPPLYVAAVDDNSGIFHTLISSPTAAKNSYSIKGVQTGNFKVIAILDMNNNGYFDLADYIGNTNDKSLPIVIVPPNLAANTTLPAADITLTPADALVKVSTIHDLTNGLESYTLQFEVRSVNKKVVNQGDCLYVRFYA